MENKNGGSGAGYLLPGDGLKNARLERRALMAKWGVPADRLPAIVERQLEIAEKGEDREATQAFKAVLAARQQDLDIEKMETGEDAPPTQTTYNTVNVQVDLLKEPAYLEYLRERACQADSHPCPVRADGEPRAVEDGQALSKDRPSLDGSPETGQR
jgi:hypothetical protein